MQHAADPPEWPDRDDKRPRGGKPHELPSASKYMVDDPTFLRSKPDTPAPATDPSGRARHKKTWITVGIVAALLIKKAIALAFDLAFLFDDYVWDHLKGPLPWVG